jgi:hypothetical protein
MTECPTVEMTMIRIYSIRHTRPFSAEPASRKGT